MRRGAAALLLWLFPTLVLGQSLADVARKEKERRQKNEETGVKPRVVTDEELKAGKGELANDPDAPGMYEPASTSPLARSRPSRGDDEETRRQNDAASWRGRKALALAKVESARQKHETYKRMWLAPVGEIYVNRKTKQVIGSVGELQKLTADAKAELDAAQKALEDLEEEARRANVPPGWLR